MNFKCHSHYESLLKYLLVKTAPVLGGIKPAVLLRLNNCPHLKSSDYYRIFCRHQNILIRQLKLQCMIMKHDDINLQILFYDANVLWRHLNLPRHRQLLHENGYAKCGNLEAYLTELRNRFANGQFPHEIGLFLGYPLKDVRGYMAHAHDYVTVPRGMWRVFGDPGESTRVMASYRRAEESMRRAIGKCPNINLCINQFQQVRI